ncbi:hypothetical protein B0H16DRAFT_1732293 [Mycena metata]|uniref:Uncharacterized protein n=1 Tax=Mycena metata TaxID=1033252 RepID=A0AAD7I3S8_9AGAR|nr:hypothetical protein B0H16DRAFT_1732293 [Mycena metata]
MDTFYDSDSAATTLEEIITDRRRRADQFNDGLPHLVDLEPDAYSVVEMGATKKSWRLCRTEKNDEVADEIVFTLQGVLSKVNLVPKHVKECAPNKLLRLSQYAEICGMGSPVFESSMVTATTIHERFAQHFCGSSLASWVPLIGPMGSVFPANNRLFTLKSDAPSEQNTDFEEGVDPVGIIERLKTADMIHAPENVVKYFRLAISDQTSDVEYLPSFPGAFHVGDLVEIQASFVAIMTGQSQIKVTTRLNALTLLDNSFTKASNQPHPKGFLF